MRRLGLVALCLTLGVIAVVAIPALAPPPVTTSPVGPEEPAGSTDVAAGPAGTPAAGIAAQVGAGIAPAAAAAVPPAPPEAGASSRRGTIAPRGLPFDAGAVPPTAPSKLTGYVWPLARGRITVDFGAFIGGTRVVDGERFHDGVDIASFCGDRVRAAHAGTVLAASRRFDDVVGWAGSLASYYDTLDAKKWWYTLPITVVIADGNGYRSIYAHLARVSVKVGQRVAAGDQIGLEGATGRASGCHLHYGLFSPLEAATFAIRNDIVKRLETPAREIARVDPALVLPARPQGITIGWGVSTSDWDRLLPTPTRGR